MSRVQYLQVQDGHHPKSHSIPTPSDRVLPLICGHELRHPERVLRGIPTTDNQEERIRALETVQG